MKFNLSDYLIDIDNLSKKFRENARVILLTSITISFVTIAACLVVFFVSLKPAEKVMVPDLQGKDLTVALLEMQGRELYPKIQLKYSDNPHDKGMVLEQNPNPGSIVKAGRRINLVISRGIIVDQVENFVGQKLDEVKIHLQALFTSSLNPLLSINEPVLYRFSTEPAGTILEQNPAPETPITAPIQVNLVVSRGPENDRVRVPDLTGKTITNALILAEKAQIVFDFTSRFPEGSEQAGTVVSQMPAGDAQVNSWSRVAAVVALPVNSTDGKVYGILTENLPVYPYPFQIKVEAVSPKGERYEILSMKHPGGLLTVPYAVQDGTVLALTILNKEVASFEVHKKEEATLP